MRLVLALPNATTMGTIRPARSMLTAPGLATSPPHTVQVEGQRFSDVSYHLLARSSDCDAAGQIWDVGRIVAGGFLADNCILHSCSYRLSPACFRMLPHVPGGKSCLMAPGAVTKPEFTGCLFWRWPAAPSPRKEPSVFLDQTNGIPNFRHSPVLSLAHPCAARPQPSRSRSPALAPARCRRAGR